MAKSVRWSALSTFSKHRCHCEHKNSHISVILKIESFGLFAIISPLHCKKMIAIGKKKVKTNEKTNLKNAKLSIKLKVISEREKKNNKNKTQSAILFYLLDFSYGNEYRICVHDSKAFIYSSIHNQWLNWSIKKKLSRMHRSVKHMEIIDHLW